MKLAYKRTIRPTKEAIYTRAVQSIWTSTQQVRYTSRKPRKSVKFKEKEEVQVKFYGLSISLSLFYAKLLGYLLDQSSAARKVEIMNVMGRRFC